MFFEFEGYKGMHIKGNIHEKTWIVKLNQGFSEILS